MELNNKVKFKETEIGIIPEEWDIVTIGSMFNVETGKNVKTEEKIDFGRYEILGANGRIGYTNNFLFDGEYILTGRVGTLGKLYYRKDKFWPSDNVLCISKKENSTNLKFLFYYLKILDFHSLNRGSTQPLITQTDIKNYLMPLPEDNEQFQMVEILSSLDDKIELNRKINSNLEKIASLLFKQWFVDIGNDLPRGWKIKPLQEVFDFLEGPGIRNWQYSETGTRFINIRLINQGDIDVMSANYINQKDVDEKYQHFLLKKDDLVLSASGTLGRSAIVRKNHLPLLLNTSVIRFRPRDGISYPFMYQYLQSKAFLKEQVNLSSGSVQVNFGPTHLKQMSIVVPDDETLARFNKICGSFYKLILFNLDQNNLLQRIRDSLLPRLMSGKIRVSKNYE